MFYQSWHIAGFHWDKCQTPKKDFNCLRLSLGSLLEFVFAEWFHGSLQMGNTEHGHGSVGMGFPSTLFTFSIKFQVFWLCSLPRLWIPLVLSLHCSYSIYIFLVLMHLLVYVLFLLLDYILLEVAVLDVIDIERLLSWGLCILLILASQNLLKNLEHCRYCINACWMATFDNEYMQKICHFSKVWGRRGAWFMSSLSLFWIRDILSKRFQKERKRC